MPMYEKLRVAVVGPGAIGLFYASRLAQAGADVGLVLRSDYQAVSQRGVEVRGKGSAVVLGPDKIRAWKQPEEAGPVDLVLITLKNTANGSFAQLITPLLGENTAILTLQNGLGADEELASLFGAERILGGLSFIACNRIAPGVVECFHPGSITLGEFKGPASERAKAIAAWFEKAGIVCKAVDKLAEARWKKLIWNVPFNGLSIAAGGLTTDKILGSPELAAEVRQLMQEVAQAAHALGHDISERFIQSQIDATPGLGAYKPSSLLDWLAGKEVEVEAIWGEPLRRATAAGANCPRMALLYALLKEQCRTDRNRCCGSAKAQA